MADEILDSCTWPDDDEPGIYVIGCSCGRWNFRGSASECATASQAHDDSPWRSHVVTVRGKVRE